MHLPRLKIHPILALFLAAVVLGLGVAWLVMHTLRQREAAAEAALQAKAHAGEVAVVVPVRNLKPGQIADSSTMAQRSVPRDLLPPDAVTANDWPQYDGHPLARAVYRGIPMRSSDFGVVAHYGQFLSLLQAGERAITTDVSTDNSIAGLLQPGNKVDILMLMHRGNTVEEIPVLHQVTVLATGQDFGQAPAASDAAGTAHNFGNITLALSPRQTAILTLAEQAGTLRVALDPQQPQAGSTLPPLHEAALFGGAGTRRQPETSVQYIIGSPGQNQTMTLPLATPVAPAARMQPQGAPAPAAVKAIAASSAQTLSNLQALLRQSPVASPSTHAKP